MAGEKMHLSFRANLKPSKREDFHYEKKGLEGGCAGGSKEVKMTLEISASCPRLSPLSPLLKISVAILIIKNLLL